MVKIHIVGAGPGSPDYVTPIAIKTIEEADLVVGADRVLKLFSKHIRGEKIVLTAENFQKATEQALKQAERGYKVVFISTGDPCFSGLLKPIMRVLGDGAEVNVVPGISSLQVCAARLKISWDEAAVISFHEGVTLLKEWELAEAASSGKNLIVLPDPKAFTPKDVARFLMERGVAGSSPTYICENLTLSDERILETNLKDVQTLNHKSLCVMVIKPVMRDEDNVEV